MIHIQQVQGNVVVDDVKNRYTQQARNGMELDVGGNYLIATAQNSSVKLSVNGQDFSLGASSFIRINGTKTWIRQAPGIMEQGLQDFYREALGAYLG